MRDLIRTVLNAYHCPTQRIDVYAEPMTDTCARYEITNNLRLAAFLAQVYHESTLNLMPQENLNYSSDRLLQVFGKYFTQAEAGDFSRQPEKIANRVYAGRMGNGDEASGDGWKYRGRGLIQVTGRSNYQRCGTAMGIDLAKYPDLLLSPHNAAMSAGWYWGLHGLNAFADEREFETITRKINGGLNGQPHRLELYEKALAALA